MPLILKMGYKTPLGIDLQPPGPYLAAVYGDIDYLRRWNDVLLSAMRNPDYRSYGGVPIGRNRIGQYTGHWIYRSSGCTDLTRAVHTELGLTIDGATGEVDEGQMARVLQGYAGSGWSRGEDRCSFFGGDMQSSYKHWLWTLSLLLWPESTEAGELLQWLDSEHPPDDLYALGRGWVEMGAGTMWYQGHIAEVWRRLQRPESGITAAKLQKQENPFKPSVQLESDMAWAGCKADLGQQDDALRRLDAAATEAGRVQYLWYQACARRDAVLLDGSDAVANMALSPTLIALGGAVQQLAQPAVSYAGPLGVCAAILAAAVGAQAS